MACHSKDYLTIEIERELAELICLEVKLFRRSENLKQELVSSKGFSADACFEVIDDYGLGYIYQKSLERFLISQGEHNSTAAD